MVLGAHSVNSSRKVTVILEVSAPIRERDLRGTPSDNQQNQYQTFSVHQRGRLGGSQNCALIGQWVSGRSAVPPEKAQIRLRNMRHRPRHWRKPGPLCTRIVYSLHRPRYMYHVLRRIPAEPLFSLFSPLFLLAHICLIHLALPSLVQR